MTDPNNILHFLNKSTDFLKKKGIPSARTDAEWILADLLRLTRIQLYAKFEMPLSSKEIEEYRERIVDRSKSKPVAYIIGKKGFHQFDFFVNESVLIPRPETEELVELIRLRYEKEDKPLQLWDLGTGSGCIGLSLAKLFPHFFVTLTDISEESLNVAKKNAENLQVNDRCNFILSDLANKLSSEVKFDLILSNPPYIPLEEKEDIMKDVVAYEPHQALFIENIFEFHKQIFQSFADHLIPTGVFAIETHPKFIHKLADLASTFSLGDIEIIKDSSSKDRFIIGKSMI
ncbi:release factor glutamine methyltransferase [Leptospira ryugenii]|uniref:Release factor glutamine methyltransferase n=1 Tax=Leptospira ryugenii TaxID=1917863 RepID=A0A2P2DVG1_9LEPT|nr:peptide chain release factor N(5)-glutamine methyltransferase [Leptospira ryugenii]GBF48593.1 release factor glutamine methyltransferase [Leptospira ryugenii]